MLYNPPINGDTGNANRSYVNANPSTGVEGSIPSAAAIEYPQREILAVITAAGLTPSNGSLDQLKTAIQTLISAAGASTGTISAFGMSTPLSGWLECNGAAISRTTYATLYAAIGTAWGAGDGSTTFNIPDFRGEFLRGWDHSRGIDAGRAFASYQDDAMQGHIHYVGKQDVDGAGANSEGAANTSVGAGTGWTSSGPITDGSNGVPRTASETRPRNKSVIFCIKT